MELEVDATTLGEFLGITAHAVRLLATKEIAIRSAWILARSATGSREADLGVFAKLFEDRRRGVLKPRHFLGVRLAVMTMSWISSSDRRSMSMGRGSQRRTRPLAFSSPPF